MNYVLIKGRFHVVGYSPDGDSIKFRADNVKHWQKLDSSFPEKLDEAITSGEGAVQLRLQGVDALETHYSPDDPRTPEDLRDKETDERPKPKAGSFKQPTQFADLATQVFLEYLGVTDTAWRSWGPHTWIDTATVKRGSRKKVYTEKHKDEIPGYIVTHDVERKGRPIAWVFSGSTRRRNGTTISIAQLSQMVEKSANYVFINKSLNFW